MAADTKPDYEHALKEINGAIRRLEMYPSGHPAAVRAVERSYSALREIFRSDPQLVISRVDRKIVVNQKPIGDMELLKRLLAEFEHQNIGSITITGDLTQEELSTFLSFLVRPPDRGGQAASLAKLIEKSKLGSVKVDQLRYELVTEDEVVVKSEAAEGADLKAQLSGVIRENPDLIRDVISAEPGEKGTGGEPVAGLRTRSAKEGSGRPTEELSDDDILRLLASSLEHRLKEVKDGSLALNEVVQLANSLLRERKKTKLLPRIKKMLKDRALADEDQLDLLFDDKWLKSQELLDELLAMIEKLGSEEPDVERLNFLWRRVASSDHSDIKSFVLDKLLSKLDSEDDHTRSLVAAALETASDSLIENKEHSTLECLRERLCQKVKDQPGASAVLRDCCGSLRKILLETIRQGKFGEAHQQLLQLRTDLNEAASASPDVKQAVEDFVRAVSDDAALDILISSLGKGLDPKDVKIVERILESLDGDKVAHKLLDTFTARERTVRMSALRVMSRLGKSSVAAFSALLSDPAVLARKRQDGPLMKEIWYKMRNVIYVLGNIPDEGSLQLLSKLSRDPDRKVRLEVTGALEKIAKPQSVEALVALLDDPDDEIRTRVIASLATLGDRSCLERLKQHIRHNHKDATAAVAAVGKIGGEESTDFLLNLLWETSPATSALPSKQKDEIRVAALNALAKIGSARLTSEIERFVTHRRGGLRGLLVRDKVMEAADRALKTIKSKDKRSSADTPRKTTAGS